MVFDDKEPCNCDTITITDQNNILEMISCELKHQTSLPSIISIDTEEDDGIADLSATTHYCYGGSAGHCSQSNTSSQCTSCSSTTPSSTDT